MKKILSFLSYHNAIPLAAVVLALGAGSAFAATNAGLLPLPSLIAPPVGSVIPTATESNEVDPSTLLSANLDTFDFRPTVTGVVETDSLYIVSYSISTLAPEGSEWAASSKTGEFSVEMDALDDTGLQGYVVAKLRDIESGERTYLSRAQAAEKALADARKAQPANAFAALIGLALDQIFVPVVKRPTPEPSLPLTSPAQPSHAETQPVPTAAASGTTSPENMATSTDATASGMASIATSTPVTTGDATSTDSSSMATTTPTNENETETTQSTDSGSNPNQNPDDSSATTASTGTTPAPTTSAGGTSQNTSTSSQQSGIAPIGAASTTSTTATSTTTSTE